MKFSIGRTRRGKAAYDAQFSDVAFYDWLLAKGLTPRKSLTLGAIEVPNDYLIPLARGLLVLSASFATGPHASSTPITSTSACGCSSSRPVAPISTGFAAA